MATVNKVFLIGNLTRDPELRYTPNGSAVCEFGIAINRVFTSNNERKEETCFVDVNAWGRQAENCARYIQKGSSVCIEGRLHLDQWEDRETGRPRSKLKVVAERTQFLGAPANRNRTSSADNHQGGNYGNGGAHYHSNNSNGHAPNSFHQHPSTTGTVGQTPPPPPAPQEQDNPFAPKKTPDAPIGNSAAGAPPQNNVQPPAGGTEDDIPF